MNIECRFHSEEMKRSTVISVLLPEKIMTDKDIYTLYLLHGLWDDNTTWSRLTSLERYIDGLPLAIVMPSAGKSFYTDMAHGDRYWTFLTIELPYVLESTFGLSKRRARNFVAGNSMGGYGAFKLALSYPERIAAAASLSGNLDIKRSMKNNNEIYRNAFGSIKDLEESSNDLFPLMDRAVEQTVKPKLYQCVGTEDFLYENNARFRERIEKLPYDYTYEEEKGDHSWNYWDMKIKRVIEWLSDIIDKNS